MKVYGISVIVKPICEHDPKAQSIVYPETESDFNEVQLNLKQQIKKQYDSKRSN
jgi:histidinol dehydrogenase